MPDRQFARGQQTTVVGPEPEGVKTGAQARNISFEQIGSEWLFALQYTPGIKNLQVLNKGIKNVSRPAARSDSQIKSPQKG